jgi:O-acetyl-ADP-ribose deacetylase (regulator of RNase III)
MRGNAFPAGQAGAMRASSTLVTNHVDCIANNLNLSVMAAGGISYEIVSEYDVVGAGETIANSIAWHEPSI